MALGQGEGAWPFTMIWSHPARSYARAIRMGRYKLVLRTKEWPSELYDQEKDPGERVNRIADPALGTV